MRSRRSRLTRRRKRTPSVSSLGPLLCALILIGAACSGDDDGVVEPAPADGEESVVQEPAAEPVCPLTGEAPSGIDFGRPAVAVKIENDPASRPQFGLEKADLVFEERVEGGITRFLVVFHCGDARKAGPVRSGRFDDPKLAKPFTPVLTASGSNSIVEREMGNSKMLYLDEDSTGALFRDPPGSTAVHSLFVNTSTLREFAIKKEVRAPTKRVFHFGPLPGNAKDARRVTLNFVDSNTIEYRWKAGLWKRWEAGVRFMAASGDQIGVPNLLVQRVVVDNSDRIFDVAGNPSPDIGLEKTSGMVLLFRDGKVVAGTWKMGMVGSRPVYKLPSGDPLPFAEGPIWVELVPLSNKGEVRGRVAHK